MSTSGGHMHGAADLKPDTANGYVLRDDGTWAAITASNIASAGLATAALADDAVTSAKLDPTTIQYAELSLTAAQVKALRATPATLVAAQAGRVLEFLSAVLFYDYATAAFTEADENLAVYFEGETIGVSEVIECTGFLDQASDMFIECRPTASAVKAKAGVENKGLTLKNTGDAEFGGGGTSVLRIKTAYRSHVTGWA